MSKKNKKKHEQNGHADTTPADGIERTEKRRFTQSLPCKLDEDELQEHRNGLADVTTERVKTEGQIAVLREAVKRLKDEEDALVGRIEKGAEDREVECVEYLIPGNEIQVVRMDTGEVVESRTADAEELQENMFDEAEPTDEETRDESLEQESPGP